MSMEAKYTCINCGQGVKELYRVYSPIVLKLSTCNSCNLVVDKYIEYDPIIIIIDLVLLNREAYRHVLFNTQYNFHWKLLVILELMESYWEMSWLSRGEAVTEGSETTIVLDKFYTGDMQYYRTLFKVTCRNLLFLLIIMCFTLMNKVIQSKSLMGGGQGSIKQVFNQVMKCMTISSFGIFLFLPSLIWEKSGTEEFHFIFVIVYTTLSQLVAYTVLCSCSKLWSIIVILCAYGIKIKSSDWLNV